MPRASHLRPRRAFVMSWKWLRRALFQLTRSFTTPRRRPYFWRPMDRVFALRRRLDELEDRTAPALFTVTNVGDNGGVDPAPGAATGTLRQAIVDANDAA